MQKTRLEAFSDGVLAIIITIMVLELHAPHEGTLEALQEHHLPLSFCGYVLSFLYVGIFWNNHHHMFHATKQVGGWILWANLHLLFWLSLLPFATSWIGESHLAPLPTATYGMVLFMAAIAYWLLQHAIICHQGSDSLLARAVGHDLKGKISPLLYAAGVGLAFWNSWVSALIYLSAALMWLVPDRRIAKVIAKEDHES